ncbi:MAG: polysulfide reductase NrfD [Nocardioides sp.]|nr:polysulfide reductase NrfD [Nocardioides sp.]
MTRPTEGPNTLHGGRRTRRGGGGKGDRSMVPEVEFTSYYGRNIVKPAPWEADIPAYLFSGGLAAGTSLIAAGADLTGRPALCRAARLTALGAIGFSGAVLVHDLGKPSRFLNMLRVAKLTSPMSVGTWIVTAFGGAAGAAAAGEVVDMLPDQVRRPLRWISPLARPGGLAAAALAPALGTYTAVLLSDTATPSWHSAYRELPFLFAGSAAAASGGWAIAVAPLVESGPARRLAIGGAALELVAEPVMERSMGITAEPLRQGKAGRLMSAARVLTLGGAVGALLSGRSRTLSVLSGAALVAGSVCTRFGVFEAGQESAKDPRYTVVPQRERLAARG